MTRPHDVTGPAGPLGSTTPAPTNTRANSSRTILLAVGLAGLSLCLFAFGVLAEDVRSQEAGFLDAAVTPFFHGLASPPLDAAMNAASFIGSDPTLLTVLIAAAVVLGLWGRRREAIFVVVALAGSLVVNETMKLFFHRPRPVLAWAHVQPDYSFPSGHSMNSLVLGLALAIVVWRVVGARRGVAAVVVAVVLSLLIGVSRIYLGYHYFTDVVAGFAAAILWVAIVVAVFRGGDVWFGRHSRRGADPARPASTA